MMLVRLVMKPFSIVISALETIVRRIVSPLVEQGLVAAGVWMISHGIIEDKAVIDQLIEPTQTIAIGLIVFLFGFVSSVFRKEVEETRTKALSLLKKKGIKL